MCRFTAYLGRPIVLNDILYKPKNSLIKQSTSAKEMEEPLNGDGFGMAWYDYRLDPLPGVFKTIQPAWNDVNLETLSGKISSECFLAHVRAASTGNVNVFNTHPFTFQEYSFMHNGGIAGFEEIRRSLRAALSDEMDGWIKGQTDSEHFFALFLDLFLKTKLDFNLESCYFIVREAIDYVALLQHKAHIHDPSYINFVLSNGKCLFVLRYVSKSNYMAPSLHYSYGDSLEYENGNCVMQPSLSHQNHAVLVASEKLASHKMHWHDVPTNHVLFVNENLETKVKAL
ncbi:glutamine amidotransferase (plasmid) [Legionella adelaidensis]|uniref:Glutamine amidotransferase n=1 Tax=Legionella adelaidensis TaxID=45056 RepID=A0A0W0R1T9_9GAMM|nr:class II glutamine amidotransferase [Legionella adelaidensis]KTC65016.1 glutamine amidotransferase [Legionella adelaidensis]VEH85304.1 glutamine amidotransferase [Legionella adelaidensis]